MFKIFYWNQSILLNPAYSGRKFGPDCISKDTLDMAMSTYRLYQNIDSTEIWTQKTLIKTINQIEYYNSCGLFLKEEYLTAIYKDLIMLLKDVVNEARLATKTDDNGVAKGKFTLQLCELSLDNNSIFLETSEPKYLATGFNSFNSLQTSDKRVLTEYKHWLNAMICKSTNISGQAERIRYNFFKNNVTSILASANANLSESALSTISHKLEP